MKWKTSKELKKELHKYIIETADELIYELKEKRWKWELINNQDILCMR